jgi:hypothetical protein
MSLRSVIFKNRKSRQYLTSYAILMVGAASSRDGSMLAKKRLFIAAESRSHAKLRYFGVVSYETSGTRKAS